MLELGTVPTTSQCHKGRSANAAFVKFIKNKADSVLSLWLFNKTPETLEIAGLSHCL